MQSLTDIFSYIAKCRQQGMDIRHNPVYCEGGVNVGNDVVAACDFAERLLIDLTEEEQSNTAIIHQTLIDSIETFQKIHGDSQGYGVGTLRDIAFKVEPYEPYEAD